MSSNDPLSPERLLEPYRLKERLSAAVWRAEDTRNGKAVAIKILTRQLPHDPSRRDALLRDVRLNAALVHPFLIPVQEMVVSGDVLVMVMELLEGQPMGRMLGGRPLASGHFFALAYQIAEALRYIHGKNLIHGNINADSVMVTSGGQVKVGGLNSSNILPRRGASSTSYQQRAADVRSVTYMAPEQIGSQTLDASSDIFSLGAVLFEMATGRAPFQAETAADVARKIVEEQPPSPKSLNPDIDRNVMSVLGRCLFKDPFRRHRDAKAVLDEIARYDLDAPAIASALSTRVVPVVKTKGARRQAILFLADVANYDELAIHDANAAAKIAARMQQVLGEAVYLFNGQVIDPFGPRMVAEMPDLEAALEAGRKGEFDFSNEDGTNPIDVRLLLHAGPVSVSEGSVTGEAIEKAAHALAELPPNTLFITDDFVRFGKTNVRLRDAGGKGGLKLFTIVPPEPASIEITTAELDAVAAAEEADAFRAARELSRIRKKRGVLMAGAAALVVVVLVALRLTVSRHVTASAEGATPAERNGIQVATAAHPRRILIEPFAVESADGELLARANAIRVTSIEVLRSFPEVRVGKDPAEGGQAFTARLRRSAAGPEIVLQGGAAAAQLSPAPDVASGVQAFILWVSGQVGLPPRPPFASVEAVNAFADALTFTDPAKIDAALHVAIRADPKYLPAQILAMSFFASRGNEPEAIVAARQVAALDGENLEAIRYVARDGLKSGDVTSAFAAYYKILKRRPDDLEALNAVARYSAGVGDAARFNAAIGRLQKAPPTLVAAHGPDILLAAGKMETAIDQYYDAEVKVPNNPVLSLKIGRISVLRRAVPIAEIELRKLEKSDPHYGFHILRAYLEAQHGNRSTAQGELLAAGKASVPGDDYYTCAAEVYAMLADTQRVVASLEAAAVRKEPTVSYVLINHLFDYVQSDPRFQKVRAVLAAQQEEMRSALGQVPLS